MSYHDFNNTMLSITMGAFQEIFHYYIFPIYFIPYFYIWNNYRLVTLDSSTIRQGVFQYVNVWLHYLPLSLVVHPIHYSFHHHWNRIFQFWLHSEMFPRIKCLETIFVTPSLHKVHHASNVEYLDKNYGGVLIIWDRLFGTFIEEDDNIDLKYGITDDISSYNILWLNAHHFYYMYQLSKKLKGFSKLKVLWKSPSWHPDHDLPQNNLETPEPNPTEQIKPKELKQNDVFNIILCIYMVIEITVLSASVTTLELFKHTFSDTDLALMTTIMVVQITSIGLLLSKNYQQSNQINTNNSHDQPTTMFFSFFPKVCTWQTIRICFSGYAFNQIIQWHSNPEDKEIVEYYTFMVYFTTVQLISWIVSMFYGDAFLLSKFCSNSYKVKLALSLTPKSKIIDSKVDQIIKFIDDR
ncbi:hypothetical protein PPL_05917 [Heterostelium album PN500]|uniref:Fatty acid hydroxylase domain-containing protein n=1 Tax=Heterostelium pallidum (strain ATCC 26659 / Pp 5 / PN500) TaxID=670386 RepID=D3BBP8_HETP5|nr:hypothetical protein PPL_05917 [Heterostelium album PN500]EFA81081.1 hypothetical protein PPL_05917 [Heterostelium album PN500]|eukprot:XP_020433199.1 hypothetical protein PPL_05917 [Heterostelium album PN500]